MPSAAVDQAIREISEDRVSGASDLARRALDTMKLALSESARRIVPSEIAAVARRLSDAQPAMAIVHNVVHLVARLVGEGHDANAAILQIREELDGAADRVARTFLKVAPPHATIVTISYSVNVLAAIRAAHGRDGIAHVFVMESRPGFEGRKFAKTLSDVGIPATIVPDDVGPERIGEASCALVGADSVLRDASVVNKIGTHVLAKAAGENQKPFFVACEAMKFDARYEGSTWPGTKPRAEDSKTRELGDRWSGLFDVTPGSLVTGVATERGFYTPEAIRTMLSPGRKAGRTAAT